MPAEPYKAIICREEKQVFGCNDAGDRLLLADGERWTFEPLALPDYVKPAGFSYRDRKLIAVCTLRFQDGDWLIDGKSLDTWLETEVRRAEDERNQRRAARGLPPVGFYTTHPDLPMDAWYRDEAAPDPNAEERRLDVHLDFWRWWLLAGKLKGDEFGLEIKRLTGAVSAVAWFEGHEDEPLLLRSFFCPVTGEGGQASASTTTIALKKACEQLGCKPATLRKYCRALGIGSESFAPVELAKVRDYRAALKRRPHLKKENRTRYGHPPTPRSKQGT